MSCHHVNTSSAGLWGVQTDQQEVVWEAEHHRGTKRDERVDERSPGATPPASGDHRPGHGRLWAHWRVLLQSIPRWLCCQVIVYPIFILIK